jgi:ribbon-helix-helix CopG family protein
MTQREMTSFRLEPEIVAALRKHAEERGESLSDVLRRAALLVLGYCPTCQRKTGTETPE